MNPLLQERATGRDWPLATEEQRHAYCAVTCPAQRDEEVLRRALDTLLLSGRSESLARLSLSDIVAMILAVDGATEP